MWQNESNIPISQIPNLAVVTEKSIPQNAFEKAIIEQELAKNREKLKEKKIEEFSYKIKELNKKKLSESKLKKQQDEVT